MRTIKQLILGSIALSLLASCNMLSDAIAYNDTTKAFVEHLINQDYNKCVDLMAKDRGTAKDIDRETLIMNLSNNREVFVGNWGRELDYTFIKSEKKFSTNEAQSMPPNSILVLTEISNGQHVGMVQTLYDDQTKKIISINISDLKAPIPSMTPLWAFGLLAICVPIFNIYVITKLLRSDRKMKWLKFIAIMFLNTPSIIYAAVGGLSYKLIDFQILFGFSFAAMGYFATYCSFGIPLGGLYWLWRLNQPKEEEIEIKATTDAIEKETPTTE